MFPTTTQSNHLINNSLYGSRELSHTKICINIKKSVWLIDKNKVDNKRTCLAGQSEALQKLISFWD